MYGSKCVKEIERNHMSKAQQLIPIREINDFRDALRINQAIKIVRKIPVTDKSGRIKGWRMRTNHYTVKGKYRYCVILEEERRNKTFKVSMDYKKLHMLMIRKMEVEQ